MEKNWNVDINGYKYHVTYKSGALTGIRKIIVDGRESVIPNKMSYDFTGMDVPVDIGSKRCRLVVTGKHADIAVDGVFVDSGEAYQPLPGMPKWNWCFVILCLAIPVFSMGGALPVLLGLMGAIWTCRVASFSKKSTVVNMFCCFGIMVLCWILCAISALAITLLISYL